MAKLGSNKIIFPTTILRLDTNNFQSKRFNNVTKGLGVWDLGSQFCHLDVAGQTMGQKFHLLHHVKGDRETPQLGITGCIVQQCYGNAWHSEMGHIALPICLFQLQRGHDMVDFCPQNR